MKRMLNTLFITKPKTRVSKDGESLIVKHEGEVVLRTPVHILSGLVCLGRVYVTPRALAFCVENGTAVSFLSENGRFWGRVVGPVSGSVLLRRRQFRASDDPGEAAGIAKAILAAKIANCRTVLRRAARSPSESITAESLTEAADRLRDVLRRLDGTDELDSLRGLEGEAAATYFGVFDEMIVAQKADFYFKGRNRRPPLDRVNAMLSFAYTLLVHDASSACQAIGLDPQVGFCTRTGRAAQAWRWT